jgi:hypothetical protein
MHEKITLSLADGLYEAEQIGEIDNVLYNIYKDDQCICTIGINENGEWESNCEMKEELVKQLGNLIEPDFK